MLELIVFVVIVFFFSIRSIPVQNFIADIGSNYASEWLGAKVSIDKVEILFFDRVAVSGVYLSDQQFDTLIHVGELYVNFDLHEILNDQKNNEEFKLKVDEVGLIKPVFNLKKSSDSLHNLQFLINAFTSDSKSQSSKFSIYTNSFFLEEGVFLYANNTKAPIKYGIDFNHLVVKDVGIQAKEVLVTEREYSAKIKKLSLKESSGLLLNALKGEANFSSKGLHLKNAEIHTANSSLFLPAFSMVTKDYKSYSSFVNEVALISKLAPSKVSFKDISLFAPNLKGMDQSVHIKTEVSQTVSNLRVKNLDVEFGLQSRIVGDFNLPDFTNLEQEEWRQNIRMIAINMKDVNNFRLPDKNENPTYMTLPKELLNLGYLKGEDKTIRGTTSSLMIDLGDLTTEIGRLSFLTPIQLKNGLTNSPILVSSIEPNTNFIELEEFQLDMLTGVTALGKVSGKIGIELLVDSDKLFIASRVNGYLNKFEFDNYNYRNVYLDQVSVDVELSQQFPESIVEGNIMVRDDNLDLSYEGRTTLGSQIALDVDVNIECLNFGRIFPSLNQPGELTTKVSIVGRGTSVEEFIGNSLVSDLYFEDSEQAFGVSKLDVHVNRLEGEDLIVLNSDVLDAKLSGYTNFDMFFENMLYQASKVFPVLLPEMVYVEDTVGKFSFDFEFYDVNSILNVIYPTLQLANNTTFQGQYNGKLDYFNLDVSCDSLTYQDFKVESISLNQSLSREELTVIYDVGEIYLKENKLISDVHFTSLASNSFMESQIILQDKNHSKSEVEWNTLIFEKDGFDIDIMPSYFTVNNHKWSLNDKAHINFSKDCFLIEDFSLKREEQKIAVNGQLSKSPLDELVVEVTDVDLSDFSLLISTEQEYAGLVNMKANVSEPLTGFKVDGKAKIEQLSINANKLGDLLFEAKYDKEEKGIQLKGDLKVLETETFTFDGRYLTDRPDNYLNFELDFNQTDISWVNEFLDPSIVSDVKGLLNGKFSLTGSFDKPVIDGDIQLNEGEFILALLGAKFKYAGKVQSSEYGLFIDNMPITDEEGNTGSVQGALFHTYFNDFIYELVFNFEDHPSKRNPFKPSEPLKLDRFLIMRTRQIPESVYYGDAYMTGSAEIFGFSENLTIDVTAKTRKGTWIDFPMYGPEIIEEEGFIHFKKPNEQEEVRRADYTGVNLSLNFDVTPDAKVKLIFDEKVGDEIAAKGTSKLNMKFDKYGDIALNGVYTIDEGLYNLVLGPYRQEFLIDKGGTVSWTGSPYQAQLDLRAYNKTKANLRVILPNNIVEERASSYDEVYAYVNLNGEMTKPEISFDLEAPEAGESGKAIINRIRSDKDELNRQFFALLIQKRFIPLEGMGNTLLDVASTQINSVLDLVSDEYKLNVNLDADNVTGDEVYEFGVSKGFLDDRLVVSGSFGLGRHTGGSNPYNQTIIDVDVQYLLNEKGNFSINVFNESNTNRVINTNRGLFTQGVGVSYKEEFNKTEDFKLFHTFLNIFRKDKRIIEKDYSGYVPLPELDKNKEAIKEEE